MHAWLIESAGHRPLLQLEDGSTGIPINLHFYTRQQFLARLGHRVEIRTQFPPHHYTVSFPNPADALPL